MFETLNQGQQSAYHSIMKHITREDNSFLSHILDGPGGCGKTHLARAIMNAAQNKGMKITALAYTGRAGAQLSKSGVPASTCHSLLLNPVIDDNGDLIRFVDKPIEEVITEAGDALFVDESSMIPWSMYTKLTSLGLPIVWLGDVCQLPPIPEKDTPTPEPEGFNTMTTVEGNRSSLTENMRFKEDSGIGFISSHLRENNSFPRRVYSDFRFVKRMKVNNVGYHEDNQYDIILCGTNKRRRSLNELIRKARGFGEYELPQPNEKLICLRNDIVAGEKIYNGEMFTVRGTFAGKGISKFMLSSDDFPNKNVIIQAPNNMWETEYCPKKLNGENMHMFTFGYATSVHKFQGSQAEHVLFYDEDVSYFLDQRAFRYTAVSRASKDLTIVA